MQYVASTSSQTLSPAASMRLTVQSAFTLSKRLAFCSFFISLCALLSYPFGVQHFLAPLDGPPIHPVSALAALMLAMCLAIVGAPSRWSSIAIHALSTVVLTISALQLLFPPLASRLFDSVFSADASPMFAQLPLISGYTTACLFLLALSLRLRSGHAYAPQVLAVLAYCLPALLLVEYVLDLDQPDARVLLISVLMLLPLCAGVTLSTVRQGFLRLLLGSSTISTLTRRYLLLTMLVPYLLGLIMARLMPGTVSIWFLLLFVATSQLVGLCVCFLALSFYKLERRDNVMRRRAESLAQRDELTGAMSRSHFTHRAGRLIQQRARNEGRFSLLFIDADHFKTINDTYGHGTGDFVLRRIIQITRRCLRRDDLIARWGGEEFVVLLPLTQLTGARVIAEKIRHSIDAECFTRSDNEIHVTVSIGCAELHSSERFDELVARADRALYLAKSRGRNQTAVAA